MKEVPFEEIYKRVLKRTCDRFGFIFNPDIDEYIRLVLNIVDMYIPKKFNVTQIKDNLKLIELHQEEVIERIEYLIEEYNNVLRKKETGENGVLEKKLNTEIVEYICYEVAKELIYDKYGYRLKEYEEDIQNLNYLKSKHRSKSFRKYLDKLFEEKYGSEVVDKIEVVEEESFIPEEVLGCNPPITDLTHTDWYKEIIAKRENIPLEEVDAFLRKIEEEKRRIRSGEYFDEITRKLAEAGFNTGVSEFLKKKIREGGDNNE